MLVYSIIWIVLCTAILAYFIVRFKNYDVDEKDVICLPRSAFSSTCLIYILSALFGAASFYFANPTSIVTAVFFVVCGIVLLLKQVNQRVYLTGEDTFVSVSMFGKKTEYTYDDYKDFNRSRDGSAVLYMTKGTIKVERSAVKDEKFFKRLHEVEKKNAYNARKQH